MTNEEDDGNVDEDSYGMTRPDKEVQKDTSNQRMRETKFKEGTTEHALRRSKRTIKPPQRLIEEM